MTTKAKDVIEELFRRGTVGDESAIDELVAEDMVNHAADPLVKVERVGNRSSRTLGPTLALISRLRITTRV